MKLKVIELSNELRDWATPYVAENWGASLLVSRGKTYQAEELPGFVALDSDDPVGLITYRVDGLECEIVTINSKIEGMGIGSALIAAVEEKARSAGCSRIWLITTNDNINAMGFYQKRGFDFKAIHLNAIEESRRIKPAIPLIGNYGIRIKHEIEFELNLNPKR